MQGIVGVNDYPLAIHRPITEFEDIQQDFRTRYGGTWCVTHIPTGKSFGIRCRDWDALTRLCRESQRPSNIADDYRRDHDKASNV